MIKNQRINKYDNLKGIGIFLIVLGHMLFLTGHRSVEFLHDFIYIIHLPIFFFVAGYFSKIGPDEPIKAFKRLIIPYIIFNILFKIFMIIIGNPDNNVLFLTPTYALWFLSALFLMKMVLPIYDRLKHPIAIAIIIALGLGFLDFTSYFGFTRFIAYTQIFLIGFYFNQIKENIEENYKSITRLYNNRIIMILFTLLVIILCAFVALKFPFKVINFTINYGNNFDLIRRAIVLMLGIVSTLIFNHYVSNRKSIFTKFGKNSLAVYVLHVYIIKIFHLIFNHIKVQSGLLYIIFAIISTFVIVFLLSRDFISIYLKKLFDLVSNFLVRENKT